MRYRSSVASILAILPTLLPLNALAQQVPVVPQQAPPWQWGMGPHMWNDGYGWPMFWGGPFMMIITLIAFVWAMRLLFGHARWRDELRHGGQHGTMMRRMGHEANVSALRILNERFARGEIQKDEYEDKKATLLDSSRSA